MLGLKIGLAIAFIIVGGAKLFRAKPLDDQFKEFGLPGYFILIIGALEVAGAIGIMIPSLSLLAAIGLVLILVGAITNHIKAKHPMKSFGPAIVLGSGLIVLITLLIF